jgi:TRAP-type C4-dicarboxylate transport system permease small subunit
MIRRLWDNLEEILGSILVVAICVIMIINVGGRYVTRTPASWAEEVGTYLFIYLVFVGASLALKKRDHFAIDLVVEKMPERLARIMRIVSAVLVIVFAGIVTFYGGKLMASGWHAVTPATEMPRAIPYAAVPFGGLLMLARGIEDLVRRVRGEAPAGAADAAARGVE